MSISHTVKRGDTLSAIAKKYNTDLNKLLQSNKITDPNLIKPGQVIDVPSPKYDQAVEIGKSELRRGKVWGEVWNKIKSQFKDIENQIIDEDLGVEWREPGAFERLSKEQIKSFPEALKLRWDTTVKTTTPQMEIPKVQAPIPTLKATPKKEPTRPTVDPFAALIPQKPKPEPPRVSEEPVPVTEVPAEVKPEEAPPVLDITKSPWEQPEIPVVPFKTEPIEEVVKTPASTFVKEFAPNIFELHKDKIEDKFKDPNWMRKTSLLIEEEIQKKTIPIINTADPVFDIKEPEWDLEIKTSTPLISTSPGECDPERQRNVNKTQQELSAYYANRPPHVPDIVKEFTTITKEEQPFMSRIGSVFAEPPYKTETEKEKSTTMIWMGIPTSSKDMLEPIQDVVTKATTPQIVMSPGEEDRLKEFQDAITLNNRHLENLKNNLEELEDKGIYLSQDERGTKYLDAEWSVNKKNKELEDKIPRDVPFVNEYIQHANQMQKAFNEIATNVEDTVMKVYDFSLEESPKKISDKIKSNFQDILDSAENLQYYQQSYHEQNEYNNVYNDSLKDQSTAIARFNELETKRKEVSTPEIEKFVQDSNNWNSLSSVEKQALSNFYYLNKEAVNKLIDIAQEQQDVQNWMSVNQIRIDNTEKYGKTYDAAATSYSETLTKIIDSPEFEETVSLMAAKTGDTKLAESYRRYYESKKWVEKNNNKYIDTVTKFDSDQKIAALELNNYINIIANEQDNLSNLYNKVTESSKVVARTDLMNQMQTYKEQSDLAEGLMGKSYKTAEFSDLIKPWKWPGTTWDFVKSISNIPNTLELWQQNGGIVPFGISMAGNIWTGTLESMMNLIPRPVQEGMGWAYEHWYKDNIPVILATIHTNTEALYDYYNLIPKLIGQIALKGIDSDIAKQIISNQPDDQRTTMGADYLRRYINLPTEEDLSMMYDDISTDENANKSLVKFSKLQNWYAGRSATETFVTTQTLTSLSDLIPKDQMDKLNEIVALNDFVGKEIDITAIPKGTKIIMPRWNQGPTMMNLLAPGARTKFETSHPAMYKVADEIALLATDPLNYVWPAAVMGGSKLARTIGKSKSLRTAITALEKNTWSAKTLTGFRVSNSFLRMIRFKLPDGRFVKTQPFDISPLEKIFSKAFLTPDGFKVVMKENFTDFTSLTRALINVKGISILKEMDSMMIRQLAMETESGLNNVAIISQIKALDAITTLVDQHNLGSEIIKELIDTKKPVTVVNIRAAFSKQNRIENYQLPTKIIIKKEKFELQQLKSRKDLTVNEIMRKTELEQLEMAETILQETAQVIKDTHDLVGVHEKVGAERVREILRIYAENEVQDPGLSRTVLNVEEELLAWKYTEQLGMSNQTFYKMLIDYPEYTDLIREFRRSLYEEPKRTDLQKSYLTSKYNALDVAGRNFYDELINTQNKVWPTVVYFTKDQIAKALNSIQSGDHIKITYKKITVDGKVKRVGKSEIIITTKSGIDFEIKIDDITRIDHTPIRSQIEINKVYEDKLTELTERYSDSPPMLQSLKESKDVYKTYKGFTDSWVDVVKQAQEPIVASANLVFYPVNPEQVSILNKNSGLYWKDKRMEISPIGDNKIGVGFNIEKYKRTEIPGVLLDYNIKLAQSKEYGLSQKGVGTIKVKGRITDKATKEIRYEDLKGTPVTAIDLLRTMYMGKSGTESGWFKLNLPDKADRARFGGLLDDIVKNETIIKELGLTLKRTADDLNAERAAGQSSSLPKMAYVERASVENFTNIDIFYATAIALEDLFEYNPAAYDLLYNKLDNLISNKFIRQGQAAKELTPVDRFIYELMQLAEENNLINRAPEKMQLNFFKKKEFELAELLLRNKELTNTQNKRMQELANRWGQTYATNIYNVSIDVAAKEFMRDRGTQDLVAAERWAKQQKRISFEAEEFSMPVNSVGEEILIQSQLSSEAINALSKQYYGDTIDHFVDRVPSKIDIYFARTKIPESKLLPKISEINDKINQDGILASEIYQGYKPGKTFDIHIMAKDDLEKIINSRVFVPTKSVKVDLVATKELYGLEINTAGMSKDVANIRASAKKIKIEDINKDADLLAHIQSKQNLLNKKIKEFEIKKTKSLSREISQLQDSIDLAELCTSIEEFNLSTEVQDLVLEFDRAKTKELRQSINEKIDNINSKLSNIEKIQLLELWGLTKAQRNIANSIDSIKPHFTEAEIKELVNLNDNLLKEIEVLKKSKASPTAKHSIEVNKIRSLITKFAKELDSKKNKLEQDAITFAKNNNLEYTKRFDPEKYGNWEINTVQLKGESLNDLVMVPESAKEMLERIKYSTLEDGTPNPNYNKKFIIADFDAESKAIIKYLQDPNNGFQEGKHYEVYHFEDPGNKVVTTKDIKSILDESRIDPIKWIYEDGGLFNIKDQDLIEIISLAYEDIPDASKLLEAEYIPTSLEDRIFNAADDSRFANFKIKWQKIINKNPTLKAKMDAEFKEFVEQTNLYINQMPEWRQEQILPSVNQKGELVDPILRDQKPIDDTWISENINITEGIEVVGQTANDAAMMEKITSAQIKEFRIEQIFRWLDAFKGLKKQLGWKDIQAVKDGWRIISDSTNITSRYQEFMLRKSGGNYIDIGGLEAPRISKELVTFNEAVTKTLESKTKEINSLSKQLEGAEIVRLTHVNNAKKQTKRLEKKLSKKYEDIAKAEAAVSKDSKLIRKLNNEKELLGREIVAQEQIINSSNKIYSDKAKTIRTKIAQLSSEITGDQKNLKIKQDLEFTLEKFRPAVFKKPLPTLSGEWFRKHINDSLVTEPIKRTMPGISTLTLYGAEKISRINKVIKLLTDLIQDTKELKRYPVIVDITGQLKSIIDQLVAKNLLPEEANRIIVLDDPGFRFKRIAGSKHFTPEEYTANTLLKEAMIKYDKIYIFGRDIDPVTPKQLENSFRSKALTQEERDIFTQLNIDFEESKRRTVIVKSPGPSYGYARYTKPILTEDIGLDKNGNRTFESATGSLARIPSQRMRETGIKNLINNVIKTSKAEKAVQKTLDEMVDKDSVIFCISGPGTSLTESSRAALIDAVKRGAKFAFPSDITDGEKAIREFLKDINANIEKYSVSISKPMKGTVKPNLIFSPRSDLSGARLKLYKHWNEQRTVSRIYRGAKELQTEYISELKGVLEDWSKDPFKFLPGFVGKEAPFTPVWFGQVEKLYSKAVAIPERTKIQKSWDEGIKKEVKNYRHDLERALDKQTNGHPEKWELEAINAKINLVESVTKTIGNDIFKFNKAQRWYDKIYNKLGRLLFEGVVKEAKDVLDDSDYDSLISSIQDPSKNLAFDLIDKIQAQSIANKGLSWFLHIAPKTIRLIKDANNILRKTWIWGVLFLRPAWSLWNNLGDSVRAAMGTRSMWTFVNMQRAYVEATAQAIKNIAVDLSRFITDTTKPIAKRKYKIFTIDDYITKTNASLYDSIFRTIGGEDSANAWMLKEGQHVTPVGELLTPEKAKFITGNGLMMTQTDPYISARILRKLKHDGLLKDLGQSQSLIEQYALVSKGEIKANWSRIKARGYVIKGHIENFNTHLEEMRRMIMMSDLIFKKGFKLVDAELTTKKWLFDYRDLNKAEQVARWFFPFYAYNAKMIGLYLDQCLKFGPGVWQAGQAFLDGIDKATEDLPEHYKERISIGGKIWFMPNFGILDTVRILRDPSETIKEMIDNPSRAPFGFSWNPFVSSAIKLYTGKSYWDTGYQLKNFDNWYDYEIDKLKITEDGKTVGRLTNSTLRDDIMSVLFIYLPPLEVVQRFLEIDLKSQMRDVAWYESKQIRTIFKQFGLNYLVYDDIDKFWNNIYNLPPHLVQFYKDKIKEEDPALWDYVRDYTVLNKTAKIFKATGDEKLKLQEDFFVNYVKDQYYDMEEQMKGSGQQWIEKDPVRKQIMEDYWKPFSKTPGIKSIGERIYEVGSLKSTIRELLGNLKSVDITRIAKMNAAGIDHPFDRPFDETALRNEIYDEHGNLKVHDMDELMNVLQKYNVVKDINDLQEIAKSAAVTYQDWKELAGKAKEAKQKEDALYYTRMGTLMAVLPKDLDQMPETKAAKYWKEWNKLRQLLIFDNPKFKERYMNDLPKWQRELYDKNADYIQRWDAIINDKDDDVYDYFENFYAQPDWFKKWYFLKHPEAAISYPVRKEYQKIFAEMKPEVFDASILRRAFDYMYAHQAALKAWEKDRPGIYNYIEKMREIWKVPDDEDTMDYFERFYQKPEDKSWNDFRNFYFDKQGNEYKKTTYPFIQKWIELIEVDKKNEKLDKPTYFAEEWFWSPKNTEARKLYGENKPIDEVHTAVDYQARWREISQVTRKDISKLAGLVLDSDQWFKDVYFKKYPDRKIYYPLMQKMQGVGFDESNKIFFAKENKAARDAWERDKPGKIAYQTFWKDIGKIGKEKGKEFYYDFYFSDQNKKFRAKHEANNPGANEAFRLAQQFYKLDSDSWEARKARRQFLKDNPKLADWWARNKTEEDIAITLKANEYYDIIDSVADKGAGRAYIVDYYTKRAEAARYLKDNPDLVAYWDSNKKIATGIQATINKLLEEFNKLSIDGDKTEFLKQNPELDQYFLSGVPPGIRKLRLLEKMYWNLLPAKRSSFLANYPTLTEYWEVKRLPTSFFMDYDKFRPYQDMLNKTREYFNAVKAKNWDLAESLREQFPTTPDTRTEEGRWLLGKLYNESMSAWAASFGSVMSTYFFRSLPSYIRNEYFRRHPESKIYSYFPIGRILEEGVRRADADAPDLAWAYLQQRKYGKNIPFTIKKQVTEIMLKHHVWEDRSFWSQKRWSDWWNERIAKRNNMLLQDLERIPLLRIEAQRIAKTYSRAILPRPFKKTRGMINPFFGGSHIVLD